MQEDFASGIGRHARRLALEYFEARLVGQQRALVAVAGTRYVDGHVVEGVPDAQAPRDVEASDAQLGAARSELLEGVSWAKARNKFNSMLEDCRLGERGLARLARPGECDHGALVLALAQDGLKGPTQHLHYREFLPIPPVGRLTFTREAETLQFSEKA